jgi:hypothetical protein
MNRSRPVRPSQVRFWNAFDGCQIDPSEPEFGDLIHKKVNRNAGERVSTNPGSRVLSGVLIARLL